MKRIKNYIIKTLKQRGKDKMKCEICRKKTTIDESVGYEEFIVCNHCFEILTKASNEKRIDALDHTMNFIFKCGMIRKENGYIRIIK